MFITGPEVIKAVTGEDVTVARPRRQRWCTTAAAASRTAWPTDEPGAGAGRSCCSSYLPQNNTEDPPQVAPYDPPDRMNESLNTLVPEREDEPYDMHEVIDAVFDRDSFLEIHPYYARNAIVGFARLDG